MTRRAIAVGLSVLCAALVAVAIVFWVLGAPQSRPPGWGTAGIEVIILLMAVAFAAVGAVIALRQPENRIGWVCLGVGISLLVGYSTDPYGSYGRATGSPPLPGAKFFTWLQNWIWIPAVGTVGTFLLLLFPDGRLPSPRWRVVAWVSAAVIVVVALSEAFRPGGLTAAPWVENPYGIGLAEHMPLRVGGGMNVLLALCFLAAAASVVLRFRRSRGRQRLQLKWFAYAGALLAVLLGLAIAGDVVAGLLDARRPLGLGLLQDAVSASALGLPAAIGIAVLRHDLYEIDVVINRTLVYASLTALLAGTYFGLVLLLQLALSPVRSQSDLAVAVSTLAAAGLFRPARRRIQALVDRRFYRHKYDAQRTLERFGSRLRDELEADALSAELRLVVTEMMQPAHVSLWMRPR